MSGPKAVEAQETEATQVPTLKDNLIEGVRTLAYAVLLALFLRSFFIGVFWIPTGSMEPTLFGEQDHGIGDRVFVIRCAYGLRIPFVGKYVMHWGHPKRGDIIVFTTKGIPQLSQKKDLIKRVAGLPGDTIQIVPEMEPDGSVNGGRLLVNGKPPEEPEVRDRRYSMRGEYGREPFTLQAGEYFVLGDNTDRSNDSRFWGTVPADNVLGEAIAVYWPPSRFSHL